jgi:hypothetical protein
VTAFPCSDDGLAGLEPVLDALSDGITTALHIAVAAELRLWAAACRGMIDEASVHKPFTDPLPPFDGGRVAVYGAMAEWLDRRAGGLTGVAEADEENGVAELLDSLRPAEPEPAREVPTEKVVHDADLAAREVASYLAFHGGLTPAVQEGLRVAFRRMVDEGWVVGRVLVGDHVEGGTTVPDWAEVGNP